MTGEQTPFGLFGCSLDALDSPERVAMKHAFMNALEEGLVEAGIPRDPFDLVAGRLGAMDGVVMIGKLLIGSWLTPRPEPSDRGLISERRYADFLDSGGCRMMSARLGEFVKDRVFPLRPLLVGVDHSLTGGVVRALAEGQVGGDLALVVLDSHFDAIPASVRKAAAAALPTGNGGARAPGSEEPESRGPGRPADAPDSYGCGNWIAETIDAGLVPPGAVVVIGPSDAAPERVDDTPGELDAYRRAYRALEKRGVRIVGKNALRESGASAALAALGPLSQKQVYVSIDADTGAGAGMGAVRFLDRIGLAPGELMELAEAISGWVADSGAALAGVDLMEIDTHLADIPGGTDRTVEVCVGMVQKLIGTGPAD